MRGWLTRSRKPQARPQREEPASASSPSYTTRSRSLSRASLLRGHSGTLAQASIDSPGVLESRVVVRFAAVRLAAAVVAVLILGATLLVVAALPWDPLQGLPHSCPYESADCAYPPRAAWVLPTAVAIGLIGLAGASGVLSATRRRRIPARTTQPGGPV